jgi:hypothetical protein
VGRRSHIHFRDWLPGCLAAALLLICPRLYALELDSSHVIFGFHGPDTTSWIGREVGCLGDINSDGYSDVYISCASPFGTFVFYGGSPPDTVPDLFLPGVVWGAIDLDGDGIDDVVSSAQYGDPVVNPRGVVYLMKGYGDSLGSAPYDSLIGPAGHEGMGYAVRLGYLDGDVIGDLVLSELRIDIGPVLWLLLDYPTADTTVDWEYGITNANHSLGPYANNYRLMDFNGDGKLDIIAGFRARRDTVGCVSIFFGDQFPDSPDVKIRPPTVDGYYDSRAWAYGVFAAGDVDADGWQDLGVNYGSELLIYCGGPSADTVFDFRLDLGGSTMASAGDINGDGFADVVCGEPRIPGAGGLSVFLGGADWDVKPDGFLFSSDLPPRFLENVGWQVASAGDFNGDGYDDIVFSCQNFTGGHPGDVFIVKGGADIVASIDKEQLLPDTFAIRVFPNPSKTEFSVHLTLQRAAQLRVEIVNVLGQTVATLISGDVVSPGDRVLHWNGKTVTGARASSGVYFVRTSVGAAVRTTKMILLR